MSWLLNLWPTRRKESTVVRDPEALAALKRAKEAEVEARARLTEMEHLGRSLAKERAKNHFAPTIYAAMRPK